MKNSAKNSQEIREKKVFGQASCRLVFSSALLRIYLINDQKPVKKTIKSVSAVRPVLATGILNIIFGLIIKKYLPLYNPRCLANRWHECQKCFLCSKIEQGYCYFLRICKKYFYQCLQKNVIWSKSYLEYCQNYQMQALVLRKVYEKKWKIAKSCFRKSV